MAGLIGLKEVKNKVMYEVITSLYKKDLEEIVDKWVKDGYEIIKPIHRHFILRYFRFGYRVKLYLSYKNLTEYFEKHGVTDEIIDKAMSGALTTKEIIEKYFKK